MNEIDKIKSLKSFLQTLEYLYDNKKWLVTCEQLRELFYNDKNKRYNWLTIIQLTGLKYKGSTEYTAEKIGEIIGYSASTVENEKSKIVETIELLKKNNEIEKNLSLREIYNKYLHPDVLPLDRKEIWKALENGDVLSCFQFDSPVGRQAAKKIKPQNIIEMSDSNGSSVGPYTFFR